jgi:DNA-binding transcriptional ArsR family regulator
MRARASVDLIHAAGRAAKLLHPLRRRILQALEPPDSASGVARRLALPRQVVNYHLRELEKASLVELVEERRKGNCVERVVRASARSYLISPEALGGLAADPEAIPDRFSSAYLVAVAARAIRDLAVLRPRAERAGKRLPTLALLSEIRFASPGARNAFAEELAASVARLAAKHHDEKAPGGRRFTLFIGAYPAVSRKREGRRRREEDA